MRDNTHGDIPEPSSSKDFSFDQQGIPQGEESPKIISPARRLPEAPILVPVLDRHVLVTPVPGGSCSESVYELMRDWVHGPESLGVALANREQQQQQGVFAFGLHPSGVRALEASRTRRDNKLHTDDCVMANQTEPTLDSHLRRWKALGKQRREEFQHRKARGFEKLGRRMQMDNDIIL